MKFATIKKLRKAALVIAAMFAAVLVLSAASHLRATNALLEVLARVWKANGPHATVLGRLRARLENVSWLGPLRPTAPRDPFRECGVSPAEDSSLSALLRLAEATWQLACVESHMLEVRVEHGHFKVWAACAVAACLLGGVYKFAVGRASADDQRSSQLPSSGTSESLSSSFEMLELPPDGPCHSEVLIGYGSVRRVQRSRWWPLKEKHYSSRLILRHRRLREAMKAALFRQRRKMAPKKVPYDSIDWWHGAGDGRGKLVVIPKEHLSENFRPYRYLSPPLLKSLANPAEGFLRRPAPPRPQEESRQLWELWDVHRVIAARVPWGTLLQLVIVLLLAYLCLNGGAKR